MMENAGQRLRSRAMIVVGTLGMTLICGGWFLARVLVHGGTLGQPGPTSPGAQLFDDVVQHVTDDYVDSMSDRQLYHKAIDGMLEGLHDPHTAYLTPDRLRRLNESTSGKYVGLGIQMDFRDGWITVITPVPNSPAERAGVEAGDRLIEVNGQSTHGWTPDEATAALRGPPGSTIHMTVDRPGTEKHIPFTITREEIHIPPVRHAVMLRPGLGYVQTVVFGDSLARELRQAVDSLRAQGARTLILDLRYNPGGLLAQGVEVAELFLNKQQTIVSMRGRSPGTTREFVDETGTHWPNLGVIVLVNGLSASASEIVAGALQDHDRALIVGTPSYGKGSAQTLFALDSGAALKLTTALWYTPSGRSINRPAPRDLDDDDEDDDSVATADSLAAAHGPTRPTFRTDAGRTVYGGGGITPDVIVGDTTAGDTDIPKHMRYLFGGEHDFQQMLQTDTVIHTAERLAARATSPRELVLQH